MTIQKTAANENNHENVHMDSKKGKICKWHCMQQMRKGTIWVSRLQCTFV